MLKQKQPDLPENWTIQKSDNQEIKEETFIQTGRRGRDGQPVHRGCAAGQWTRQVRQEGPGLVLRATRGHWSIIFLASECYEICTWEKWYHSECNVSNGLRNEQGLKQGDHREAGTEFWVERGWSSGPGCWWGQRMSKENKKCANS